MSINLTTHPQIKLDIKISPQGEATLQITPSSPPSSKLSKSHQLFQKTLEEQTKLKKERERQQAREQRIRSEATRIHQLSQENLTPYFIISINGGGVRGIIPAKILTLLSDHLGLPLSQLIHCYAGTSIGGLIATGLAVQDPNNPSDYRFRERDVLRLLKEECPKIFYRSYWQCMSSGWGLLSTKYCGRALSSIIRENFGQARLSETVTDLFVSSVNIEQEQSYHFEKFGENISPQNHLLSDAILASTAAAPYLPTHNVEGIECADGGYTANNPSEEALLAACRRRSLRNRKVIILSIGTGTTDPENRSWEVLKTGGLLSSAGEIISQTFSLQENLVESHMKIFEELCPNFSYVHLQPVLEREIPLDSTDKATMEYLETCAADFFEQQLRENRELQEKIITPLERRAREVRESLQSTEAVV